MLDWLFILETEYAKGEPHWHTVTQIHSPDACQDLIVATLEDVTDFPCSYTNRGSGAPFKATGTCYYTGGQYINYKVKDGTYTGPLFTATTETDSLSRDHVMDVSQLRLDRSKREPQALCLEGYNWRPCQ